MFKKPQHRTALVALAACAGFALSGGQALAGHRNASCRNATTYVPYRTAYYGPSYMDTVTYAPPVVEYIEPNYVVPAYATTPHLRYARYGRGHHRVHRYYDRPHSARHIYRGDYGHRNHSRGRSFSFRIGAGHGRHHGHRNLGISFRYRH